jgi:hypothetical protein
MSNLLVTDGKCRGLLLSPTLYPFVPYNGASALALLASKFYESTVRCIS